MTRLLEALNEQGTGLLITVDEVDANLSEMIQLASVYQHFVGEDRKVSLVMAGLSSKVSSLLRNDSVSFLRRACKHTLGRIPDSEIERAFAVTIEEGGRSIERPALEAAVAAADGFPYMMQLVGFRIWGQHPNESVISLPDAEKGIALARKDFRERILDATYYDLSGGDIRFLKAMLEDPCESRVADIASRLGESTSYAGTYKRRLVEQGVIGERGRSMVAFDLPGFRDYLKEKSL